MSTKRVASHGVHVSIELTLLIQSACRFVTTDESKAEVSLVLNNHHTENMCVEVKALLQAFLTSALNSGEWSSSRFGRSTPGKTAPIAHWTQSRRVGCVVVFLNLCETAAR